MQHQEPSLAEVVVEAKKPAVSAAAAEVAAALPSVAAPAPTPAASPVQEAVMVPCATSNLQDDEVWQAVLTKLESKTSLRALAGRLRLVSLTRLRAVLGYAPADKLAAEMAIDKLPAIFEQVLGRPIRVVTQEIKPAVSTDPAAGDTDAANAMQGHAGDVHEVGTSAGGSSSQSNFSADAALADELVQQARQALGPETRVVRVVPRTDG